MPRKKKLPDFEQALEELEAIIERMERGELSLEESLQNFERGIQLTRNCQAALKQAEQKVEVLMEKNLDSDPVAFTDDDADAASARDSD